MRAMRLFIFSFLFTALLYGKWEKVVYPLTTEPIDVIIPCCAKDLETLELCIEKIREYGANLRRVIVVSEKRLTNKAEWFSEEKFPFSKEMIALEIFQGDRIGAQEFLDAPETRIGWIYQQFLKLYAPFVIPDLSNNVLVLDADVIFIQPVSFLGKQGEPFFSFSSEVAQEYIDHASRLLPAFERIHPDKSGIAHHMLFQRPILEDLFAVIEKKHGVEVWKALARCIALKDIYSSAMSEYEIYFNFAFLRTDQATLRALRCVNVISYGLFKVYAKHNWDVLTSHSWARKHPFYIQRP